jgi:hypothetical protein
MFSFFLDLRFAEWMFELHFSKINPHSLIHRTLAQAGDLLVAVLVAI